MSSATGLQPWQYCWALSRFSRCTEDIAQYHVMMNTINIFQVKGEKWIIYFFFREIFYLLFIFWQCHDFVYLMEVKQIIVHLCDCHESAMGLSSLEQTMSWYDRYNVVIVTLNLKQIHPTAVNFDLACMFAGWFHGCCQQHGVRSD